MEDKEKKNLRFNILTMLTYIIGLALVLQLFNLQIVHGEEYYARSSRRLTRETTIEAARGHILDRDGNILAGTEARYRLFIYRSGVDSDVLNTTILNALRILEENEDRYRDAFPIRVNPTEFIWGEERIATWKETNNIEETATAEEVLDIFKERFSINYEDVEDVRKIIAVRYGISREGFSSRRPYMIAENISIRK